MNTHTHDLSIRWSELARDLQRLTAEQRDIGVEAGIFLQSVRRLLTVSCKASLEIIRAFGQALATAADPTATYLQIDLAFRDCQYNLGDFLSDVGTQCHASDGNPFFTTMQSCASKTGIATLHFLAAWSALNLNRFNDCIKECEAIDDPYPAVYTLLGQAYLESEQYADAVESLAVATELNSDEVLAWFFLAKAQVALGKPEAAWEAISHCRRLAPHSDEIALLSVIIASDTNVQANMKLAWTKMQPLLAACRHSAEAAIFLFELAFKLEDPSIPNAMNKTFNWREILHQQTFLKRIGSILREFHQRAWHAEALDMLNSVAPESDAS